MENATYVFKNGKVITVNDNDDIVEAVAINGNKIVYVGENEGADKFISPDTKVIDLNGRALTPGFIDCHMHPILAGFFGGAIIDVTYPLCRSNAEMFDIIREAAKTTPKGQWIKVWGYDQNKYLEHTHPTIDELDAVAPDNPVQCMRICGHLGVYNTLALELGGIKSIEDAKRFPENQIVIKDGKFKIRSYGFNGSITEEKLQTVIEKKRVTGVGDEKFKFGPCKIMLDGGTSGPSCATREPYSHDTTLPGILNWDQEYVDNIIKKVHDADCQMTAHAVGDKAVEMMLNGYEKALKANPRKNHRHRIEHCALTDAGLVKRIKELGEAIRCYTINGAYASFEEDIKGSIEVGKLADFALLSEDILSYPQDKVQDIQIDMTMIDGEVVYERNGD